MKELKNTTVRLDDEMRKEVDRVAKLGGVTPADVIRMCVKHGLGIVEHGFKQMSALLQQKLPSSKRKNDR